MSQTQEPRNHHFTPQWFLKQWNDAGGGIWRTRRLPTGRIENERQLSTKSIASIKDLYNITGQYRESRIIKLAIQHIAQKHGCCTSIGLNFETSVFKKVDQDGLLIYKRVIEGLDIKDLQGGQRYDLFRFFYLLQARNPVFFTEMTTSWVNEIMPVFKEQVKEHKNFNLADLTADGNAAKIALLDIALDTTIYNRLYAGISMFTVNVEQFPVYFITSNYPYVATPDIGSEKALHFLPLSPKQCVIMSKDAEMLGPLVLLLQDPRNCYAAVDFINSIMACYSSEVYSREDQTSSPINCCLGLSERDSARVEEIMRAKTKKLFENLESS